MNAQDIDRRSFLSTAAALGACAITPATAFAQNNVAHEVKGRVEKGWERVADTFGANFQNGRDLGASCCVYLDGQPVVDIWGGLADRETGRPWQRDTIV